MACLIMQPINMQRTSSDQSKLEHLKRELAQKRKALDREVERFMSQKDAEFKEFERELKSQLDREVAKNELAQISTISKTSPTIVSRGFTVGAFPTIRPQQKEIEEKKSIADGLQSTQNTSPTTLVAESANDDSEQPIQTQSPSRRPSDQKRREFELSALFPQAYLPLLDGVHNPKSHRKALSTDESSWVSTSLNTHGRMSDDERPSMPDRRSSSSPTGTGQSLRKSSLKRPDSSGSNRGRKHVLFSIDDKVISPSSSPVSTRSAPIRNPPIPFSGLRDLPTGDRESSGFGASFGTSSTIPFSQYVPQPSTSSSRSYKELVEPIVITSPEQREQDDLQSTSKDPLFGLDEPLLQLDDEEWDTSPVETKSEEDDVDIISASPLVGSIPIQIRQPNVR